MRHDVVLVYERSCPNVAEARGNLLRAFAKAKVGASWREVDVDAPDTPAAWRLFGSPTILVDGRDVAGEQDARGARCRLYTDGTGAIARAPSVERIAASLSEDVPASTASPAPMASPAHAVTKKSALASAPAILVALLPKVFCPACWPAYAAALSALGLGFLMREDYLLPITAAFLALATLAIAYRARSRRGYAPFAMAAVASVAIIIAKFVVENDVVAYAATAAFGVAALWNAWPARRATCGACVSKVSIRTV